MATKTKKPDLTFITPENLKYHKLSDILESVIGDVKAAVKAGFVINMNEWMEVVPNTKCKVTKNSQCMVCLGGAAILGFMEPPPSIKKISIENDDGTPYIRLGETIKSIVGEENNNIAWSLMSMFNNYRVGDWSSFCYYAKELGLIKEFGEYSNVLSVMKGFKYSIFQKKLSPSRINTLLKQIEKHVFLLRQAGF
jgi:hypothetical protein